MANVGINSQIPLLRRNRAFLGVQYGYIDLANLSPPPSSLCMWQVAGGRGRIAREIESPTSSVSSFSREDHQIGFS